jgi:hypothetical protein
MSVNSYVRAVREFQWNLTAGLGINVGMLGSEEVTTTYVLALLPLVERKIRGYGTFEIV